MAKLRAVLAASGRDVEGISKALEGLANTFSLTTTFSKGTVLQVETMLALFGASSAQISRGTRAILDFSAATGRSAEEVARLFELGISTGSTRAFGRLGLNIANVKSPLDGFTKAVELMESKSRGAAEATGKTLAGAFAILRNSIQQFLETAGEPLLAPLTFLVNTFAKIVQSVTSLAREIPGLTRVIGITAVVVAVLLLAASAALGILAAIGALSVPVAAGLEVVAGAVAVLSTTFAGFGVSLAVATGGLSLLIPIIVGLIILIVRNIDIIKASFNAVRAAIATFIDLAKKDLVGFGLLLAGTLTFNPALIVDGLAKLREAIKGAADAARNEYDKSMKGAQKSTEELGNAIAGTLIPDLEEAERELKKAKGEIEIFVAGE
jgi:hypothetical protein